jgi:bis(5'-adenosyl)-triphosphatase
MPRRPNDFKENDQVYDELNKKETGAAVTWRTKEEMKKEADELRHFFKYL